MSLSHVKKLSSSDRKRLAAKASSQGLGLFSPHDARPADTRAPEPEAELSSYPEAALDAADESTLCEYVAPRADAPVPDECRTYSQVIFVSRKLFHTTRDFADWLPIPTQHLVEKRQATDALPAGRYETLTVELWRDILASMIDIENDHEAGRLARDAYEQVCRRYLVLVDAVDAIGGAARLPRNLN